MYIDFLSLFFLPLSSFILGLLLGSYWGYAQYDKEEKSISVKNLERLREVLRKKQMGDAETKLDLDEFEIRYLIFLLKREVRKEEVMSDIQITERLNDLYEKLEKALKRIRESMKNKRKKRETLLSSWTRELSKSNSVDIDKEIEVWAGYWAFFNGLSKERAKKLARDIKRLLRRINQKNNDSQIYDRKKRKENE